VLLCLWWFLFHMPMYGAPCLIVLEAHGVIRRERLVPITFPGKIATFDNLTKLVFDSTTTRSPDPGSRNISTGKPAPGGLVALAPARPGPPTSFVARKDPAQVRNGGSNVTGHHHSGCCCAVEHHASSSRTSPIAPPNTDSYLRLASTGTFCLPPSPRHTTQTVTPSTRNHR
jgi:hypothetical protein